MPARSAPKVPNEEIADALERVADLLEAQDGEIYRVRAYRRAADTLRELERPAAEIVAAEGRPGLEKLPGIGKSIAALLDEYVHNLRLGLLARLEGQVAPEDLFTTVPGLGEELAARIHRELGVETLEELELAAHDGRLARVRGIGPRRLRGIRDSLAAILSRSARRRARRMRWLEAGRGEPQLARAVGEGSRLRTAAPGSAPEAQSSASARLVAPSAGASAGPGSTETSAAPPLELLLEIDAEYRRRAEAGELRCIAPRRFNPSGEAWLPVLHTERDGWHFTALYSNTARAHELGRTRDWVVVYWERDGHEDQCTVVTERSGPRTGRRVVRGWQEHAGRDLDP